MSDSTSVTSICHVKVATVASSFAVNILRVVVDGDIVQYVSEWRNRQSRDPLQYLDMLVRFKGRFPICQPDNSIGTVHNVLLM